MSRWSECEQREVDPQDVLDREELAEYYRYIGYEWWREPQR